MVEFDLAEAHPDYQVAIEGLIRGLLGKYAWVPLRRVKLYEPDPDDRSLGNADTPGIIALNARWFREPPEILQRAAQEGYRVPIGGTIRGWHGDPAWPEPQHVVIHEFFHIACDALPGWQKWARAHRLAGTRDPSILASGYALAGDAECFAEEATAYELGHSAPDGLAELLGGGGAQDAATISKTTADYVDHPVAGERCADCTMFVAPHACTLVKGSISQDGHCKHFDKK